MYFYLQQFDDEAESAASSVAVTPDASPAPSVNGDDENYMGTEFFNMSMDDAASDTTTCSSVTLEDTTSL
ncbi:hypothetical protein Ccrd_022596 [Cynara cardunculus var. scolymus]|uniref:Uncharacterized protein n=2 Tax=Cynara cardunculus var. scolymus TaxID=59895 RepID=A0A124SE72_CYNCS|nr:hypothetical protein Ccrd_022596 [Cynara cardunculus var. scolymus]